MTHDAPTHDRPLPPAGPGASSPSEPPAPHAPPALTVLLDLDGTLLDSNDAHAHAWVEVLRRHGRPQPFAAVRPMIGKGGDKLLSELVGLDPDSDEAERITQDRRALLLEAFLPRLQPTHGARELLQQLRARGHPLVIATSAGGDELQALLRQAGVDDLIETAATASDAEHSKPDPDILQAALRRAAVPPSGAVMIGDTPYDIEAARRAGVPAVVLRCGGGWSDADFTGAAAIYDDPADLVRRLDASPLAAGSTAR